MARDARFISSMVRPAVALIGVAAAIALVGCARSAPELPPDVGSVKPSATLSADRFSKSDLEMTCGEIADEQQRLIDTAKDLTGVIESNRAHNQAAGYFGGLFLLPLVAVEHNDSEKASLDRMQVRWDTLEALERFQSCPPTSLSTG